MTFGFTLVRTTHTCSCISLTNRKLESSELLQSGEIIAMFVASLLTVRRRCLQFALRGYRARSRRLITDIHRRKGIQWTQRHASWTCRMSEKMMLSVESTFSQFGKHTYM